MASFGSFRIADFRNAWSVILVIGNNVFMKYMHMNLHDKWFRSKASSASRLSPDKLASSNVKHSSFCVVTISTQSHRGEGGVRGKFQTGLTTGVRV